MRKLLTWFKYKYMVWHRKNMLRANISLLLLLIGSGQMSEGTLIIPLIGIPLLFMPEITRKVKSFSKYYKEL